MPKITLENLANLDNPPSAVSTINENFQKIQQEIDLLLSRDGSVPNTMLAMLDMNSNRVINLPAPISDSEAARHGDLQGYVDAAEDAQEAAEDAADIAVDAEEGAVEALGDLVRRYIGAFSSDPTTDPSGDPLIEGAIYFNTTNNQWRVFALDDVHNNGDEVLGPGSVVVGYWLSFPQATLNSQNDVDVDGLLDDQLLVWNNGTGLWIPFTLNLENVPFDNTGTGINSSNGQEAIEEILTRTSLGVYDISLYAQDLLVENEQIFRILAARPFTIPVDVPGSSAVARVAANTGQVISIRKNGTQVGTIEWSASETEGVFTVSGDVVFNEGDLLSFDISGAPDTALRDISISIAARR